MKVKNRGVVTTLLAALLAAALLFAAAGVFAEERAATAAGYFSSEEELTFENGAADTRGVTGMTVTMHGVDGKDSVSLDYLNYIAKEELAAGFLELAFLPETVGKADFDYVLVTLTDAEDEAQKLVYAVAPQPDTAGWWNEWTAAWAGYSDDVEPVSSVKFQFNSMLKIRGTEQYLVGYNQSFIAPTHIYYTGPYMEVGYNLGAKRQFFVQESENAALNSMTFALSGSNATISGNIIADLVSEEYMSTAGAMLSGTPYEGIYSREYFENLFTSGYCKLKITYLGCNSDNITCHIRKIGGQWMESNPDGGIVNASPYFAVEHDTNAVLGVPFALPETRVIDFREGDISAKADYTFLTKDGQTLRPENGAIVFPRTGDYEMRCSVRLESGELFSVSRSVTCYETMPKTQFLADISFADSYKTGDTVAVPPVTAKNDLSTNGDKSVPVSVYLQIDGAEEAVFSAGEYNYYVPEKAGRYVICYLFQNAYGAVDSVACAFDVEESVSITPAFLPVTLTSAKDNSIADCTLTNYVDDTLPAAMYRAAYVNGDLVFLAQGDKLIEGGYVFNGTLAGTSAVLTYKAGFSQEDLAFEKSYVLPVIAPQYAEDYIVQYVGDDYSRTAQTVSSAEEVIFTAEKDTGFMLPQVLPADGLEFSFDVKAGGEYDRLNVVLRDYEAPNKRVVFSLKANDATTSMLYVNGVYEATVSGSLVNDNSYFQWRFDGAGSRLANQSGVALTQRISAWEDGTSFTGFGGGLCVLAFELEGVRSATSFALKRVNNQPFFTTEIGGVKQRFADVYSPTIFFGEEPAFDDLSLGGTASVPAAAAYDVLSPISEVKVSLTKPDGSKPLDGAGCASPASVMVDQLGRWIVEYVADDGNELFPAQRRYVFDIEDDSAPKIYVDGVPTSAKAGEETQFPAAYVFDNVTQNCECYVIVIAPDGFRRVAEGGKFVFPEAGKYIVQYYAYDDAMNVARLVFTVSVS